MDVCPSGSEVDTRFAAADAIVDRFTVRDGFARLSVGAWI
jgi:hypothetical protein